MIVWSFRQTNKLCLILLLALTLTQATNLNNEETSGDEEGYYDYYGDQAAVAAKTQHRAVPEVSNSTAKSSLEDTYNYDYAYDDETYDYTDKDNNDPKHQFIGNAPNVNIQKAEEAVEQETTSTGTYTTQKSSPSKLWEIMAKPGILAGLVGGAIIGVLTAVLLIMFIVYRMKKKDEGSYALEETKKPLNAYDYRHCPTKEFYA